MSVRLKLDVMLSNGQPSNISARETALNSATIVMNDNILLELRQEVNHRNS